MLKNQRMCPPSFSVTCSKNGKNFVIEIDDGDHIVYDSELHFVLSCVALHFAFQR